MAFFRRENGFAVGRIDKFRRFAGVANKNVPGAFDNVQLFAVLGGAKSDFVVIACGDHFPVRRAIASCPTRDRPNAKLFSCVRFSELGSGRAMFQLAGGDFPDLGRIIRSRE